MSLYYKIRNAIREARYNLKCKYQRAKRGYANGDVWDMDLWFIDTIKSMLIHLKEHGCGFPMEFDNRYVWCAILDEMIGCLSLMSEDDVRSFLGFDGIEGWKRMEREDYDRVGEIMIENRNRFFELFNKYFYYLWD